ELDQVAELVLLRVEDDEFVVLYAGMSCLAKDAVMPVRGCRVSMGVRRDEGLPQHDVNCKHERAASGDGAAAAAPVRVHQAGVAGGLLPIVREIESWSKHRPRD